MTEPIREPMSRRQITDGFVTAARRLGTFTVALEGNALAPRFEEGDLLLVDTRKAATPGDTVIAAVSQPVNITTPTDGTGETENVRYAAMVLNGDGDLTDGAGGWVPRGSFTLVGTVTGKVEKRESKTEE